MFSVTKFDKLGSVTSSSQEIDCERWVHSAHSSTRRPSSSIFPVASPSSLAQEKSSKPARVFSILLHGVKKCILGPKRGRRPADCEKIMGNIMRSSSRSFAKTNGTQSLRLRQKTCLWPCFNESVAHCKALQHLGADGCLSCHSNQDQLSVKVPQMSCRHDFPIPEHFAAPCRACKNIIVHGDTKRVLLQMLRWCSKTAIFVQHQMYFESSAQIGATSNTKCQLEQTQALTWEAGIKSTEEFLFSQHIYSKSDLPLLN